MLLWPFIPEKVWVDVNINKTWEDKHIRLN
jgi:hypothetical protein